MASNSPLKSPKNTRPRCPSRKRKRGVTIELNPNNPKKISGIVFTCARSLKNIFRRNKQKKCQILSADKPTSENTLNKNQESNKPIRKFLQKGNHLCHEETIVECNEEIFLPVSKKPSVQQVTRHESKNENVITRGRANSSKKHKSESSISTNKNVKKFIDIASDTKILRKESTGNLKRSPIRTKTHPHEGPSFRIPAASFNAGASFDPEAPSNKAAAFNDEPSFDAMTSTDQNSRQDFQKIIEHAWVSNCLSQLLLSIPRHDLSYGDCPPGRNIPSHLKFLLSPFAMGDSDKQSKSEFNTKTQGAQTVGLEAGRQISSSSVLKSRKSHVSCKKSKKLTKSTSCTKGKVKFGLKKCYSSSYDSSSASSGHVFSTSSESEVELKIGDGCSSKSSGLQKVLAGHPGSLASLETVEEYNNAPKPSLNIFTSVKNLEEANFRIGENGTIYCYSESNDNDADDEKNKPENNNDGEEQYYSSFSGSSQPKERFPSIFTGGTTDENKPRKKSVDRTSQDMDPEDTGEGDQATNGKGKKGKKIDKNKKKDTNAADDGKSEDKQENVNVTDDEKSDDKKSGGRRNSGQKSANKKSTGKNGNKNDDTNDDEDGDNDGDMKNGDKKSGGKNNGNKKKNDKTDGDDGKGEEEPIGSSEFVGIDQMGTKGSCCDKCPPVTEETDGTGKKRTSEAVINVVGPDSESPKVPEKDSTPSQRRGSRSDNSGESAKDASNPPSGSQNTTGTQTSNNNAIFLFPTSKSPTNMSKPSEYMVTIEKLPKSKSNKSAKIKELLALPSDEADPSPCKKKGPKAVSTQYSGAYCKKYCNCSKAEECLQKGSVKKEQGDKVDKEMCNSCGRSYAVTQDGGQNPSAQDVCICPPDKECASCYGRPNKDEENATCNCSAGNECLGCNPCASKEGSDYENNTTDSEYTYEACVECNQPTQTQSYQKGVSVQCTGSCGKTVPSTDTVKTEQSNKSSKSQPPDNAGNEKLTNPCECDSSEGKPGEEKNSQTKPCVCMPPQAKVDEGNTADDADSCKRSNCKNRPENKQAAAEKVQGCKPNNCPYRTQNKEGGDKDSCPTLSCQETCPHLSAEQKAIAEKKASANEKASAEDKASSGQKASDSGKKNEAEVKQDDVCGCPPKSSNRTNEDCVKSCSSIKKKDEEKKGSKGECGQCDLDKATCVRCKYVKSNGTTTGNGKNSKKDGDEKGDKDEKSSTGKERRGSKDKRGSKDDQDQTGDGEQPNVTFDGVDSNKSRPKGKGKSNRDETPTKAKDVDKNYQYYKEVEPANEEKDEALQSDIYYETNPHSSPWKKYHRGHHKRHSSHRHMSEETHRQYNDPEPSFNSIQTLHAYKESKKIQTKNDKEIKDERTDFNSLTHRLNSSIQDSIEKNIRDAFLSRMQFKIIKETETQTLQKTPSHHKSSTRHRHQKDLSEDAPRNKHDSILPRFTTWMNCSPKRTLVEEQSSKLPKLKKHKSPENVPQSYYHEETHLKSSSHNRRSGTLHKGGKIVDGKEQHEYLRTASPVHIFREENGGNKYQTITIVSKSMNRSYKNRIQAELPENDKEIVSSRTYARDMKKSSNVPEQPEKTE